MKNTLATAFALLAFSKVTAADFIYVVDFKMFSERDSLSIRFFKDPSNANGQFTLEASFGSGVTARSLQAPIIPIVTPDALQEAVKKLTSHLNNPNNTYINLKQALTDAGWTFP